MDPQFWLGPIFQYHYQGEKNKNRTGQIESIQGAYLTIPLYTENINFILVVFRNIKFVTQN